MFIVANESMTPWVKITEKVSFHIASEASYVYILSGHGQKVTKNAKNGPFLATFWKPKTFGRTVLPDRNWRKMPKLKNSNATFLVIFNYCGLHDYWVATIRSSLSSRLQPSQLAKINGLCIWVDLLLWGISARPILYSVYSSPGRMPMPPPQYGMKRWRVM